MRKFLTLSKERQHKELAKALLEGNVTRYLELLKALNLSPLPLTSFKERADAYHYHLKEAGISLKEHRLLPRVTTLDHLLPKRALPYFILLDGIRSAHNVGSIIRTAEAFGIHTLIFRGITPKVTHKQVKDAAMGCDEWITALPFTDFETLPRPLIALETSPDAKPIESFPFPPSGTLLLGNEEYGLSDEALNAADEILKIELVGRKNSLNVANAFAIAAFKLSLAQQR